LVWVWSQKAREAATMAAAAEATREDPDETRVTVRSLAVLAGMASATRGLQSLGQLPAVQPLVPSQLVAPEGAAVFTAMEMSLVTAQSMYFTLLSKVRS